MKELVDHIRTVHFTLLVICLVLLATSFEEKKRPLVRADGDARAIEELSRNKDAVLKQIDAAAGAVGAVPEQAWFKVVEPTPRPMTNNGVPQPVEVVFRNRSRFVYFASARQESGADHVGLWSLSNRVVAGTNDVVDASAPWRTLSDFIAFWDEEHVFYAVPPLQPGVRSDACPAAEALPGPVAAGSLEGNLLFERIGGNTLVPAITAPGAPQELCSFAPQPARDLGINVRTLLKKALPYDVPWNSSPSSAAFADLLNASKGLEALPLNNLVEQLDVRVNTDTEKVELFQAKIPTGQMAAFGSIILCACEFYLLLHLRELWRVMANKGSEEIPTGYIGIYMDRLSQIFTILSVTVLPVGSLIFTAIKAHSGSRIGFSVAIGSVIFSVVVDAFTCREFLRIHEISAPVKLGSNAAVVAQEWDC